MRKHPGIDPRSWLHIAITLVTCTSVFGIDTSTPQFESDGVTIKRTGLRIDGDLLELHYRIQNNSAEDIWICESIAFARFAFESYVADDDETLMIRRRLGVPTSHIWSLPPTGAYIRLQGRQTRSESLVLHLPVKENVMFASGRNEKEPARVCRMVLEIGYYRGNLFRRLIDAYHEQWTIAGRRQLSEARRDRLRSLGNDLLYLNAASEGQGDRDERMLLSYGTAMPDPERVLVLAIDDLPQALPEASHTMEPTRPDLNNRAGLEIRYEPSMLEYFFPHESQQALLSLVEKEFLGSQATLVIRDREGLRTLDECLTRTPDRDYFVHEGARAHITCHRSQEPPISLISYESNVIDLETKRCYWYEYGTPGLRALTPQVHAFDLRVACASNLKDLWRRLRLYHIAIGKREPVAPAKGAMAYPSPEDWCNAMVKVFYEARVYPGMTGPHKCPSAGDGRCHYAMNPHCEPDSASDMVLLFEAKAGWNQQGGAELFTFDNHEPRGGCVLLNDGTVRFIRTVEELHALRWE